MLSIDEAIEREREVAEIHRDDIVPKEDYHNMPWIDIENELNMRSAEEHEQLAEWLEELKAYREIGTVEGYKSAIKCYTKEYLLRRNLQDQNKEQYSYMDEEVSDDVDVCEWKKLNGNSCLFETSCGNVSGMYRGFNFCPYCGKKIKVVE